MSLILRVDVDKPYGRATFLRKVMSKICEDYWFPAISSFGYLHDLKKFLVFLAEEKIRAHIYFRKCTLPPKSWLDGSLFNGHKLGLHAENTRSFEMFKKELEDVQEHFIKKLTSFTKHGSGKWKGGRNHYPPYEPDKYLEWAETLDIPFLFGNKEDMNESGIFYGQNQFYPSAFWIDRPYTNCERSVLQSVIEIAKKKNLIVIIHPANFMGNKQIEGNLRNLVSMARQIDVSWVTI